MSHGVPRPDIGTASALRNHAVIACTIYYIDLIYSKEGHADSPLPYVHAMNMGTTYRKLKLVHLRAEHDNKTRMHVYSTIQHKLLTCTKCRTETSMRGTTADDNISGWSRRLQRIVSDSARANWEGWQSRSLSPLLSSSDDSHKHPGCRSSDGNHQCKSPALAPVVQRCTA